MIRIFAGFKPFKTSLDCSIIQNVHGAPPPIHLQVPPTVALCPHPTTV